MDSTSLVPQPATVVPPQELVTLPTALPQSFPTFEGPVLAPRAPSSTPHMGMPLPGHCYVPPPQPWSWPGRGPAFQDLNLHLYQPVPVHPGTGAAAGPFLSTVSKPPAPHPQQLTRISTTQTPSSYSPALGRIFSSQSPASLPGPAGPAAAQSQSSLTSGPLITLLPASTPALPPASSQSAVASVSAAPSRVTAPPAVQTMMQDWQNTFFKSMKAQWQAMMGDAPPQLNAGPSILRNMDPSGLRADRGSPTYRSCSQDNCWRSTGSRRHRASPSHASCHSRSQTSTLPTS